MAFTATLTGESTSSAVVYGVNNYIAGKYLRQFDPGDVIPDIMKFRVPGTNGSLIIRGGKIGHKIQMAVRYIANTIETLEAAIATDLAIFETEAVTITHNGQTYNGCNIIPGSVKRSSPVQSTGRVAGDVFVDLSLAFSEDQPS